MRIDRIKFATALARADLKVKELAEKAGVSRATITAIKNGKSCSESTGQAIVAILGKSIIETNAAATADNVQ